MSQTFVAAVVQRTNCFNRRIKVFFAVTFLVFVVGAVVVHLNTDETEEVKPFLRPAPEGHIIVVSTTLFEQSKFYPNNTIAILFNAHKRIPLQQQWTCRSTNAFGDRFEFPTEPRHAHDPIIECDWNTFIATCQTVPNAVRTELTLGQNGAPLAVRKAVRGRLPLVACFSPLFLNERWQLLALSIESFALAGVTRQVYYFMSALAGVHELLQAYKQLNVVDVNLWPVAAYAPARLQLDWRNQAAAHSDCYLKYRQAADFVLVSDIDDFLFPRLASTLLEELQLRSNQHPSVASFFYPRLESEIVAAREFVSFDPVKSLRSIVVSARKQTGKSVHRTELVETVWLHWAPLPRRHRHLRLFKVAESDNAFIHVRNWTFVDDAEPYESQNSKKFQYLENPEFSRIHHFLDASKLHALRTQFESRFPPNIHKRFLKHLNTSADVYYDQIDRCYTALFAVVARHNRFPHKQPLVCPTPVRCRLEEQPGVHCFTAVAQYHRVQIGSQFYVEYLKKDISLKHRKNGCTFGK